MRFLPPVQQAYFAALGIYADIAGMLYIYTYVNKHMHTEMVMAHSGVYCTLYMYSEYI